MKIRLRSGIPLFSVLGQFPRSFRRKRDAARRRPLDGRPPRVLTGSMGEYRRQYERSRSDPEGFWRDAATMIDWVTPPGRILDDQDAPLYRWFPGAELNTCFNALDRHVEAGRGDQAALVHDSPVTGVLRTYTYRGLRDEVAVFAGALRRLGVGKGDRVVIYMAMVPETVVAMLACARLGAVHSVVFGGFGAKELAARIDDARPVVVVASSCGVEAGRVVPYLPMLDAALALATHRPRRCVVLQRPEHPGEVRDLSWSEAIDGAQHAE
jgi:propionyl-CoA synthetase